MKMLDSKGLNNDSLECLEKFNKIKIHQTESTISVKITDVIDREIQNIKENLTISEEIEVKTTYKTDYSNQLVMF